MSETVLGTALSFARHGLAVFPVNWPVTRDGRRTCSCGNVRGDGCSNPAKHPYAKLAPRGVLSATVESGVIKHWFGYAAPDANLGLATDPLIVVDVDERHDGFESLEALERDCGELPPTWRTLSGGGGEHIIFRCPDGVEVHNVAAKITKDPPLGKGIDVRARGGYIVSPPSKHISGRPYAWNVDFHPKHTGLAEPPAWLIDKLALRATAPDQTKRAAPSSDWERMVHSPITEYRDMAAARIAGHLFRHSCDYQIVRGLVHAWNRAWCKPPLGYHELDRIIERIAAREATRIERECQS
jgi:Bifunctional DNA primase/polymerase, N-terminal